MTQAPYTAVALPTLRLGDDEKSLVDGLLERLGRHEFTNQKKAEYYEGKHKIKNLGISIPPHLQNLETAVGWPGIVVDVLEERLTWYGWASDSEDDFGLQDIYIQNELGVEGSLGHLDALIYGTSFVEVGTGFEGEPNPLITVESARTMTGVWDARTRRLSSALKVTDNDNGAVNEVRLYLPNTNYTLARVSGMWKIVDRDDHNIGRVLVARLRNRPRAERYARSEITQAVMNYTDMASRTLLAMEVNREFYSSPQRWIMGADEKMFTDENGNLKSAWQTIMGRILAAPAYEDDEGRLVKPEVGQFTANSPAPFIEQVELLCKQCAAEAGIPVHYFGFVTENPTSADAIRQGEARLIREVEQRQEMFGRGWMEVARLALLVRDGGLPENFNDISVKWREAATPTRSAAADEAVKLSAGDDPIIPRNSAVLYDRIGLTPQEQRQLENEKNRRRAVDNLRAITDAVAKSTE